VAQELCAAVSDSAKNVLVPDHTLVSVCTETADEAHYLCAMLNSTPSNFIVSRYVALHPAPHILKYIRIARFSEKISKHRELADLSRRCHEAKAQNNSVKVNALEKRIDRLAAATWGLTDSELQALSKSVVHK
jgi:hypothetical protein